MGYGDYQNISDELANEIFARFPKINARKMETEVNKLYTPYLFVKREKDRVLAWSSCCRHHGSMPRLPRTILPKDYAMLYGHHNDEGVCPWCGKKITVKEVGRLGKRKNLIEYHPVVFLNAKAGDIYARCYWSKKDYLYELDAPPQFRLVQAVRFSIGKAEKIDEGYGGWRIATLEGNYDPVHRVITEPFTEGSFGWEHYTPYFVFGMEALARSDFKYCQYDRFKTKATACGREVHHDLMKYLAAYCIYPRQIEMLMKWHGADLVHDLVGGRRKNSAIIKWQETDFRKAFGLTASELKGFEKSGCDIYAIRFYKEMKKRDLLTDWSVFKTLQDKLPYYIRRDIIDLCKKRKLSPERVCKYLTRFTGSRCYGGYFDLSAAWRLWKDYMAMAETLGRDLDVETVLMPRNLEAAHNELQTETNLQKERIRREKDEELRKAALESLERRRKKYNIDYGGYFIRIAETAEEVRQEGKTLQHCVGGYAERHINGTTTILFLRSCSAPEVSLYTIEMNKDNLVQIHGYKNEGVYSGRGRFAADPKETMAWMLKPWLAWIKKGSPRDKNGVPKLPKIKEAKTA